MSQRLDDVTGAELPRLTSRQREQQREAMIDHMNATTRQVNAVTASLQALQTAHERTVEDVQTCFGNHAALRDAYLDHSRSLWARLRWLVTGR